MTTQQAKDVLWYQVLQMLTHMSRDCYLLALEICFHKDIHAICGKHSTLMPRILTCVLGNSSHLALNFCWHMLLPSQFHQCLDIILHQDHLQMNQCRA